jgi:hypothetical protein
LVIVAWNLLFCDGLKRYRFKGSPFPVQGWGI